MLTTQKKAHSQLGRLCGIDIVHIWLYAFSAAIAKIVALIVCGFNWMSCSQCLSFVYVCVIAQASGYVQNLFVLVRWPHSKTYRYNDLCRQKHRRRCWKKTFAYIVISILASSHRDQYHSEVTETLVFVLFSQSRTCTAWMDLNFIDRSQHSPHWPCHLCSQ